MNVVKKKLLLRAEHSRQRHSALQTVKLIRPVPRVIDSFERLEVAGGRLLRHPVVLAKQPNRVGKAGSKKRYARQPNELLDCISRLFVEVLDRRAPPCCRNPSSAERLVLVVRLKMDEA